MENRQLPLQPAPTRRCLATALGLLIAITAWAQKQLFNDGWMFRYGDGNVESVGQLDGWKTVNLPHDWSINMPFSESNPSGNDGGYLPTGTGWYKKTFEMDAKWQGGRTDLYFEGVYMNSDVYVNGQRVGGHPYGYTSFFCDISNALHAGSNTLLVRVDNSKQKNCRWYTGSGIYRNVWLIRKKAMGIDRWGVQITTPTQHEVHLKTTLYNRTGQPTTAKLAVRIGNGATASRSIQLDGKGLQVFEQVFVIDNPRLWSPEQPNRYKAVVELLDTDGKTIDREERWFGIRTIAYDATHGLTLNGRSIKLNGGCLHHDNGILGAAAWKDAEIRKVQLMKQAGYNAARTSHNPPSEAFLDACDSLGLLVIDEAFDGWRSAKNTYDYSTLFDQWFKTDIEAMVRRDRNHPSVFCWSVGNEIIERKERAAVATAYQLREQVRRWDDTRPITSALAAWDKDWEIYDPLASAQDIVGYNYMMHKAEGDHQRVLERVMWQTESYPKDAFANWKRCMEHPYIVGDFVWTSLDYIGESGIGRYWHDGDPAGEHYDRPLWPWHAAYCGDVDLTGYLKPVGHYRSLLWNENQTERLYMAVREPDGYEGKVRTGLWATWPTVRCWNWPGWEGKDIEVVVYSREPKVSLYLNDKLIATKAVDSTTEYKAVFRTAYRPGVLRAVAGHNEQVIRTAGKAARIVLKADRKAMESNGLAFVEAWIEDNDGNVCPLAADRLTFDVDGGELLAVGSADITDPEPYYDNNHRAWHGHALAVVHSKAKKGKVTVRVKADGLKGDKLSLPVD